MLLSVGLCVFLSECRELTARPYWRGCAHKPSGLCYPPRGKLLSGFPRPLFSSILGKQKTKPSTGLCVFCRSAENRTRTSCSQSTCTTTILHSVLSKPIRFYLHRTSKIEGACRRPLRIRHISYVLPGGIEPSSTP